MEEYELEWIISSTTNTVWHYRTIKFPTQGTKDFFESFFVNQEQKALDWELETRPQVNGY